MILVNRHEYIANARIIYFGAGRKVTFSEKIVSINFNNKITLIGVVDKDFGVQLLLLQQSRSVQEVAC